MKSLQSKKAILVVSFGTSYHDTRKVTIDAIEQEIATAYPDYKIYRAWTSGMILQKLKKRDNIHYDTVKEAMVRMKNEGITDVIVQPTHVINGIENELMIQDALFYSSFSTIRFGTPLLTTTEDNDIVIEAIHKQFSYLTKEEALVLMGHGTTHYSNSIYAALDYTFKDKGYQNIFVGTVEAYPTIVSGDHATNDMAGDDIDSWKTQFLSAGYDVQCHLKGLGEYEEIRDLFLKHISDVIISMDDKTTV